MTDAERIDRLERIVAFGRLRGPDPTARPEYSEEFSRLRDELQQEVINKH